MTVKDTSDRRARSQIAMDEMLAVLRLHGGSCPVDTLVDETNARLPNRWREQDAVNYGRGTVFVLEGLGQIKVGSDAIIRLA